MEMKSTNAYKHLRDSYIKLQTYEAFYTYIVRPRLWPSSERFIYQF